MNLYTLVTGLQAGANISGDLKDPARSIPKGTLLALLLSAISYAVFVVFAGGAADRDARGLINATLPCIDAMTNNVSKEKSVNGTFERLQTLFITNSNLNGFIFRLANMVCIIRTQLCN